MLLGWHLPALYDLTLRNVFVHDLEHLLFFATALLLWVHLVPGATARPQLSDGQRVAYGTGRRCSSAGCWRVVLGFAPAPVYDATRRSRAGPGGLSALADQQIAAGIMWVPASLPFLIAIFCRRLSLARPIERAALGCRFRPRPTTEGDLMTVASFMTGSLLTLLIPRRSADRASWPGGRSLSDSAVSSSARRSLPV